MEKKWWVLIVVIVVLVLVGVYFASDDVALAPAIKKGIEVISPDGEEELPRIPLFDEEAKLERIDYILENGEEIELEGRLETFHYDDFENSRSTNEYFIYSDGERYKVYFEEDIGFVLGEKVKVRGRILDFEAGKEIAVEEFEILEDEQGEIQFSPNDGDIWGNREVAIILANFLDNQEEPISHELAAFTVFDLTNPTSINNYYREVSYNQLQIDGDLDDVYGYYSAGSQADCWSLDEVDELMNLAEQDIVFTDYDILVVIFPFNIECHYGGWASNPVMINGPDFCDGVSCFDGTIAHEIGHVLRDENLDDFYGFPHANLLECGEEVIGDSCEEMLYGDPFDIMGSSGLRGHINSLGKQKAEWLAPAQIAEISNSGEWTLFPLETVSDNLKMLRVHLGNNQHYSVEYRRPIGFDSYAPNLACDIYDICDNIFDGVLLHFDDGPVSLLLDNSPHDDDELSWVRDRFDSVLREGQAFSFEGVSINVIEISEESAQVSVSFSQCRDGIDNDGDGLIDMEDPQCFSLQDEYEDRVPTCEEGWEYSSLSNKCFYNGYNNHLNFEDTVAYCENEGGWFPYASELNQICGDIDLRYDEYLGSVRVADERYDGHKNWHDEGFHFENEECGHVYYDFCGTQRMHPDTCEWGEGWFLDDQEVGFVCLDNPFYTYLYECNDGLDNDNDGATDYPEDFSCYSVYDNDETYPEADCQDGEDNDGDGLIDMDDPSCEDLQDNDELYEWFAIPCVETDRGLDVYYHSFVSGTLS
ncbi:MAG: hypothetical protein ABIH92_03095, partial [Nanoarchaeota archaeon]